MNGRMVALSPCLIGCYWALPHLYKQQYEMYHNKVQRCDKRIVSISQPYVRPIVRVKLNNLIEFGPKLSVSLTVEGLADVDASRWDAFNECQDFQTQVESYKARYGHSPKRLLVTQSTAQEQTAVVSDSEGFVSPVKH